MKTISSNLKLKNIDAIVWDLDGTLIDSFNLFLDVSEKLSVKFKFSMPTKEFMLKNYHGSLEDTLKATFNIKSEDLLKEVLDEFMILQDFYYQEDVDHHFYDDAVKVAHESSLQGIKQIVVTNRAHHGRRSASPHHIIGKSIINTFISEIKCRDQVEFPKPDPRVLENWLDDHGLHASKIIVIGDQHIDAQLAINLQAQALLVMRDAEIPHLGLLKQQNVNNIFIVKSLHDVKIIK